MRPESDENKCRLCLSIGSSIPIYPTSIVEQGDLENIDEKIRFIANSIKVYTSIIDIIQSYVTPFFLDF